MRMSFPEGLTSPEMEIAEGGIILDNKTYVILIFELFSVSDFVRINSPTLEFCVCVCRIDGW